MTFARLSLVLMYATQFRSHVARVDRRSSMPRLYRSIAPASQVHLQSPIVHSPQTCVLQVAEQHHHKFDVTCAGQPQARQAWPIRRRTLNRGVEEVLLKLRQCSEPLRRYGCRCCQHLNRFQDQGPSTFVNMLICLHVYLPTSVQKVLWL